MITSEKNTTCCQSKRWYNQARLGLIEGSIIDEDDEYDDDDDEYDDDDDIVGDDAWESYE